MMDPTAHLSDEQLSTFLDNRLDPAEQEAASAHLQHCAACGQSLQEFTDIVQRLSTLPTPSLPRSFQIGDGPSRSFWSRLLSWGISIQGVAAATAALFVVLLGADLFAINSPAGIAPLPSVAQPKAAVIQRAQPTDVASYAAPTAGGRVSAGAPAAAPAPPAPKAASRAADSDAEQTAPSGGDNSLLEALTASNGSAKAAGPFSILSATTIGVGLVALALIVVALMRRTRQV